MRIRYFLPAFVLLVGLGIAVLTLNALAAPDLQPAIPPDELPSKPDSSPINLLPTQSYSLTFPPGPWPWYAQGEITLYPDPVQATYPTEICVGVVNLDPVNAHQGLVQFGVANLGIGIDYTPLGHISINVPPNGYAQRCLTWVPAYSGSYGIEVLLSQDGVQEPPLRSLRNIDSYEPLSPGVPHSTVLQVGNPLDFPTTITLGIIPHLPDWGIELSQDVFPDMDPGETRTVTLTVTPSGDFPPDGTPIVDVEGFVGQESIGGVRKLFRPPVVLHRPGEPTFAEREITINPYPLTPSQPTELCVELHNLSAQTQDVQVAFAWSPLGIALPFTPIGPPNQVILPPYSIVNSCIFWVPPMGGSIDLQAELYIDNYPTQVSQRNLDADEFFEPGIPHTRPLPVRNPFDRVATINLAVEPRLPGWMFEISPTILPNMDPFGVQEVMLTVIPPPELPPEELILADILAFDEQQIIVGGIRKIYRPPIWPHPSQDPIYAERELSIQPYPVLAGAPTMIGAEIRNPSPFTQTFNVQFSVSPFGIGLPFTPINPPIEVTQPPNSIQKVTTVWIPPLEGLWCVQVEIQHPGQPPVFSRRNIDVGEPLELDLPHSREIPVGNPEARPVTITLGLIPHIDGWEYSLSQDVLSDMQPGEIRPVVLTVTPHGELPTDGSPVVDVEAFIDGNLIGGIRKLFRPPVPVHRPQDPVYAESEIGVFPYPIIPGDPVELSVEVFNPTDQDQVVTATFSIAQFGIGLPFNTANIAPNPIQIFVPAGGAARGFVVWQPLGMEGKFCVRVTLQAPGHAPVWSQRNIDVGEPLQPGVPHSLQFPLSSWPYESPVTVTLGLINHRPEWQVSLEPSVIMDLQPGEVVPVTLTVTPPADAPLGNGEPVVDVEAYVNGELLGGFRKLDAPPVPVHRPHEKGYAESEISFDPDPPRAGQPGLVSTFVYNTSGTTVTVNLDYAWAAFGLGIPFTTTGMVPSHRSITLSPGVTDTVSIAWTPSLSGPQCVEIQLSDPQGLYEPQVSQRNVDVVEDPGICGTSTYTASLSNATPFTVTIDVGAISFNLPPGWTYTVSPTQVILGPYGYTVITVTINIPCLRTSEAWQLQRRIAAIQQESSSMPILDVEGYIDGELVGGVEFRFPSAWQPPGRVLYLPLIQR